ncbi:MAG: ATP synthase F1 subunit delta [Bacteroidales bacterium]
MNISKIPKRYAKALFDVALTDDAVLEEVKHDIQVAANALAGSRELRALLRNPSTHFNRKKAAIKAIFESRVNDIVLKFLIILITHNREAYLQEIAHAFMDFYKAHKNIKTVYLSSAVNIDHKLKEEITNTVAREFNSMVELRENVRKDLIGGFIIRVDDMEMDLSLRNQIKKLKHQFRANIYQGKFK